MDEDNGEEGLPESTGKVLRYKIVGTIELDSTVSLIDAVKFLEELQEKAKELGVAEVELSSPRIKMKL